MAADLEVDFDVFDLTDATVAGELSPLRFDQQEYTPFEQFLLQIRMLPEKPKKVRNYALSVKGRVVNDRMEKYLAHEGESSSLLKEVLKSPRHYLIAKNEALKPKNTGHFELGTFCHQAFLEPSKFDRVIVEPKNNRGTIEGNISLIKFCWDLLRIPQDTDLSTLKLQALKDKVAELETLAKNEGYTFIPEESFNIIRVIKTSYNTYGGGILPKMTQYLKSETSMYGIDHSTGLKVKIRPDGLLLSENWGINAILSVKTTCASSVEAFIRDCAKFRYELSEGMYLKAASQITGRKFTATVMIMAQTVIPFQVAVFYWDAEDLQVGKYKYEQAMDIIKQCRDANSWPGFDAKAEAGAYGIIQCKLPDYIKSELLPQYLPE